MQAKKRIASVIIVFIFILGSLFIGLYCILKEFINESSIQVDTVREIIADDTQVTEYIAKLRNSIGFKILEGYLIEHNIFIPEFHVKEQKDKLQLYLRENYHHILLYQREIIPNILQLSQPHIVNTITFFSFQFTILTIDIDWYNIFLQYSPLCKSDTKTFIYTQQHSITYVFVQHTSIGIINFILTYIVLSIIGISLPITLSFILAFTSIIPIVPSTIIWIPLVQLRIVYKCHQIFSISMTLQQIFQLKYINPMLHSYMPGDDQLVRISLWLGLYAFGKTGQIIAPVFAAINTVFIKMYTLSYININNGTMNNILSRTNNIDTTDVYAHHRDIR